jgi:DNA invertase Pin-like site-specific DNA recombinase
MVIVFDNIKSEIFNGSWHLMLFGYARVSTKDQNLHMQFDALKNYGVKEENIFSEKSQVPKKTGQNLMRC